MYLIHSIKFIALTIVLAALSCLPPQLSGHAQSSAEGKVKGVTTDQWGARIPNVTVVFESVGLRREVKSNGGTGEFELVLPAGEYRVSAELEAFHPYKRKKLRIEAGKTKKLKVKLKSKYPPITE
ncbi:MAG TPA: carboxypeptidase-like regulatory domain-containing protein [Pyrinomonadaceae bacterium]|nr:carboxypeptidase-like regulatory domain-containing protein [Pyrinomonadaceae bacterium]